MERKNTAQRRAFVGVSGGVDSSVAAALLKAQGFDVTGVFIKGWHPEFLTCTWQDDRRDAMRVCAHLEIPFVELDLSDEYKKQVVDYLIREYRKGNTPNPDVMCNRHIKFGAFFDWAMEKGADVVATGHYARITPTDGVSENKKSGTHEPGNMPFAMRTAVDANKDQTYFLWAIPREKLSRILFPIGEYTKPEVREHAKKYGLPTAEKKDSQGVCFLGQLDMKDFLSRYIGASPGDVINEEGKIIGSHDGAVFYTLGQRHGFLINKNDPKELPHYVVGKDTKRNTLTVAHTPLPEKIERKEVGEITLEKCNWFTESPPEAGYYESRFRYRQPLGQCEVLSADERTARVALMEAPSVPPQGQSLVLYRGEFCIGGGIIC